MAKYSSSKSSRFNLNRKKKSNTKKAKKLINWHPKTNLPEGIKKFIEWYKTEYDV